MITWKVKMLGEFTIECGDVKITSGRSHSKVWLMIAYLIFNRKKTVMQDELIFILGGGQGDAEPTRMLRNARWNARKTLQKLVDYCGAAPVNCKGGVYVWNPEISVALDVEYFDEFYNKGIAAKEDDVKEKNLKQALEFYKGAFLYSLGGGMWVNELTTYFEQNYLNAVKEILPLLNEAGNFNEILSLCHAATSVSPYDEFLAQWTMRAQIAMGNYEDAAKTYEIFHNLLFSELGVDPSKETQKIHQEIIHYTNSDFLATDVIEEMLREKEAPTGALICDFTMFRYLYQVEARSADRRGDAIHIAILSLIGKNNNTLTKRVLKRAMEQLSEQLEKTLRVGDIATPCSASQYILMLVQANYENSQKVCERIVKSFSHTYPNSSATVHSTILPLRPMFDQPDDPNKKKM